MRYNGDQNAWCAGLTGALEILIVTYNYANTPHLLTIISDVLTLLVDSTAGLAPSLRRW